MLFVEWQYFFFSEVGEVPTRGFWLLSQSVLWESANASNRWVRHSCLHLKHFFPVPPPPSWMPPAGLSDIPGEAMVKLYCPKCMDVYTPKSSRHHHTDGAYFGTGFPHMLFMVHPEYRPKRPANQFVPRCVWRPLQATLVQFPVMLCVRTWTFLFLFQAVRFQNSPNGLSAPTPGRIKFQEPCEDDSLTLTTALDSLVIVSVFEAVD